MYYTNYTCPKCGGTKCQKVGFQNLQLVCFHCGYTGQIFRPSQSPKY